MTDKCWRVWGQRCHLLPPPSARWALLVLVLMSTTLHKCWERGKNQSVGCGVTWPLGQVYGDHSETVFIAKCHFSKWLLLQAQEKKILQTKTNPGKQPSQKRSLCLQQRLPAERAPCLLAPTLNGTLAMPSPPFPFSGCRVLKRQ